MIAFLGRAGNVCWRPQESIVHRRNGQDCVHQVRILEKSIISPTIYDWRGTPGKTHQGCNFDDLSLVDERRVWRSHAKNRSRLPPSETVQLCRIKLMNEAAISDMRRIVCHKAGVDHVQHGFIDRGS